LHRERRKGRRGGSGYSIEEEGGEGGGRGISICMRSTKDDVYCPGSLCQGYKIRGKKEGGGSPIELSPKGNRPFCVKEISQGGGGLERKSLRWEGGGASPRRGRLAIPC